jgi:hypothetical protein
MMLKWQKYPIIFIPNCSMRKFCVFVVLVFCSSIFYAQEKANISKGFITLVTNQKMEFTNLHYDIDKIIFTNIQTKSEFTYFVNSVKLIEDIDKNVLYAKKIEPKLESKTDEIIAPKDTLFKPNYPEGIYKTKDDFINKKPSEVVKIIPKGLYGFTKLFLNSIEHNCFFYYDESDEKIKNTFAVSFQGHLYFQINAILSNRNKTDRAQSNDFPNSFVRVIIGGENYFYTEANLANQWAQGLAYGAIGGATGGALAAQVVYGKGIVWDFKNNEFNIFKNCEDYNDFAKQVYPKGTQECNDQQPNVLEIRKIMKIIK